MSTIIKTISLPSAVVDQYEEWKARYDREHIGEFNLSGFVKKQLLKAMEE